MNASSQSQPRAAEVAQVPTNSDALWLTAESTALRYYDGSGATGEDLARRQYAFALGYYQARKGLVAIPYRIAQLIRSVFVPRNPNKLRNCAPEVIEAAKYFIVRVEADFDAATFDAKQRQQYSQLLADKAALVAALESLLGAYEKGITSHAGIKEQARAALNAAKEGQQ